MTSRRASLLLCSVAVHVLGLALLIALSAVAPGFLPTPVRHIVLKLEAAGAVRAVDIPLPRQRPKASDPTGTATVVNATHSAPDAPPLVAPDRIADETGREGGSPEAHEVGVMGLSGAGVDGLGLTPVEAAAPRAPGRTDPIRLHSGITAPRKVTDVAPAYPALARTAGIDGIVILEVTIDTNGRVADAHVLRSVPLLDQAALDAVKRWAFTPARLNNEPVPVVMTVTVRFVLDR
jgi:protein TonB